MQCNCGGHTKNHEIVRQTKVVGKYEKCTSCGHIHWLWKPPEVINKRETLKL